jgi:hypothetical protein
MTRNQNALTVPANADQPSSRSSDRRASLVGPGE